MNRAQGQIGRKDIWRKCGDEHAARHAGDRQRRIHQIRADFAGALMVRQRTVELGYVVQDGIKRAAAAGRVRRHERRKRQIGQGDGITETQGALAHRADEHQGDAFAEPGFGIAKRENVGREDEPDGSVGKAAESPKRRLRGGGMHETQAGGNDHADKSKRGGGDRLGDDSDHHGGEKREVAPCIRRKAVRRWRKCDGEADDNRHSPGEEGPAARCVLRGRSLRRGGHNERAI